MNRKTAISILRRFGFTQPQATLFYTGYINGPFVMAKLAREAKIPRSSAYYVMEELLRRGFFTTQKQGRRIYYVAASGEQLIDMVREREQLIKELLKHLKST